IAIVICWHFSSFFLLRLLICCLYYTPSYKQQFQIEVEYIVCFFLWRLLPYISTLSKILFIKFFIFGYSLTKFNLSDRRDIYLHLAEHQKVSDFFVKVKIDTIDNLSCREFAPP